jgi:hypothetical protein
LACYRLKVIWIDATPHAAQMIQINLLRRHVATNDGKRGTVRRYSIATISELTIAIRHQVARPNPATALGYRLNEFHDAVYVAHMPKISNAFCRVVRSE